MTDAVALIVIVSIAGGIWLINWNYNREIDAYYDRLCDQRGKEEQQRGYLDYSVRDHLERQALGRVSQACCDIEHEKCVDCACRCHRSLNPLGE